MTANNNLEEFGDISFSQFEKEASIKSISCNLSDFISENNNINQTPGKNEKNNLQKIQNPFTQVDQSVQTTSIHKSSGEIINVNKELESLNAKIDSILLLITNYTISKKEEIKNQSKVDEGDYLKFKSCKELNSNSEINQRANNSYRISENKINNEIDINLEDKIEEVIKQKKLSVKEEKHKQFHQPNVLKNNSTNFKFENPKISNSNNKEIRKLNNFELKEENLSTNEENKNEFQKSLTNTSHHKKVSTEKVDPLTNWLKNILYNFKNGKLKYFPFNQISKEFSKLNDPSFNCPFFANIELKLDCLITTSCFICNNSGTITDSDIYKKLSPLLIYYDYFGNYWFKYHWNRIIWKYKLYESIFKLNGLLTLQNVLYHLLRNFEQEFKNKKMSFFQKLIKGLYKTGSDVALQIISIKNNSGYYQLYLFDGIYVWECSKINKRDNQNSNISDTLISDLIYHQYLYEGIKIIIHGFDLQINNNEREKHILYLNDLPLIKLNYNKISKARANIKLGLLPFSLPKFISNINPNAGEINKIEGVVIAKFEKYYKVIDKENKISCWNSSYTLEDVLKKYENTQREFNLLLIDPKCKNHKKGKFFITITEKNISLFEQIENCHHITFTDISSPSPDQLVSKHIAHLLLKDCGNLEIGNKILSNDFTKYKTIGLIQGYNKLYKANKNVANHDLGALEDIDFWMIGMFIIQIQDVYFFFADKTLIFGIKASNNQFFNNELLQIPKEKFYLSCIQLTKTFILRKGKNEAFQELKTFSKETLEGKELKFLQFTSTNNTFICNKIPSDLISLAKDNKNEENAFPKKSLMIKSKLAFKSLGRNTSENEENKN